MGAGWYALHSAIGLLFIIVTVFAWAGSGGWKEHSFPVELGNTTVAQLGAEVPLQSGETLVTEHSKPIIRQLGNEEWWQSRDTLVHERSNSIDVEDHSDGPVQPEVNYLVIPSGK